MANRVIAAALLTTSIGLAAAALAAADNRDVHGEPVSGKRIIPMAAVELKGGTTVDKEPFPQAALPAGDGYVLKKPDASGRWEVSTYRWEPSQIIVQQGDEVTLEIIGINGDEHPGIIEGYGISFIVKRGHVSRVTFKADKAGVFRILCEKHHPSMHGELLVLSAGSTFR